MSCIDRLSRVKEAEKEEFEMKDHIVLLGFNEVGMEVAEVYRHRVLLYLTQPTHAAERAQGRDAQ